MQDILIKAGCYIAVIILGIILRRTGFFKEDDFNFLTKLVIKITLPATLISSSAGMELTPSMLSIVLLGFGGGVMYMIAAWLLHLRSDKEQRAFAILNTPGYNIGTFALPFTQNFLGSVGVMTTSLFDVGNVFICMGGAYSIAAMVKDGKGFDAKRIVRAMGRSVPFLTYMVMMLLNLLRIRLPEPVLACARTISSANAFLAMLMIGVGFHLSGDFTQIGQILRVLMTRFGLAAVLALAFYFLLPFDLQVRQTLVILAFAPVGAAVPGFTAELESDVGLSCTINSLSILISIAIIVTLLVVML